MKITYPNFHSNLPAANELKDKLHDITVTNETVFVKEKVSVFTNDTFNSFPLIWHISVTDLGHHWFRWLVGCQSIADTNYNFLSVGPWSTKTSFQQNIYENGVCKHQPFCSVLNVYEYGAKSCLWMTIYLVCAPSQWETMLQCNIVSHWLGAFTKWSLLVSFASILS